MDFRRLGRGDRTSTRGTKLTQKVDKPSICNFLRIWKDALEHFNKRSERSQIPNLDERKPIVSSLNLLKN